MPPKVLRVKTPEEVFLDEKQKLKPLYGHHLKLGWTNPEFSDEEQDRINSEKKELITNPPAPTKLDQQTLEGVFERCLAEVETVWGAKLPEKPVLKSYPYDVFISEMQRLEDKTSKAVGKKAYDTTRMKWQSSPHQGVLLFPELYPYSPDDVAEIVQSPYDLPHIEHILSSAIARVFCRQMRGEWKQGYLKLFSKQGAVGVWRSCMLLHTLDALTQDALLEKHPGWALYAFRDKFSECFCDAYKFNEYRALQVLSEKLSLAKLAQTNLVFMPNIGARDEEEFNSTVVAVKFDPKTFLFLRP